MLLDACPPLVWLLKPHHVLHYWRLNLADMLQTKPAVFDEKMRGTWCSFFSFSFSLVNLNTHISPSHYPSPSSPSPPLAQSRLCSPLFEVAQECSANSWPEGNKLSLESALCQIGWSSLSVVVILADEGGRFRFLPLRLGRAIGSKGAPWRVVKGAA